MFGSRQMLKHANTSHLDFDSSLIQKRKLSQISRWAPRLQSHTWRTCKTKKSKVAILNFTKIKAVRPRLNATTSITIVLMLCISHLDYLNAMLYGITKKLLEKYQRIQNMCAKSVLNKCKYNSATDCLKQPHWLPIEQQIQYIILVIAHKSLNRNAPKYIQELIKEKKQALSRSLRFRSLGRLLHTPRILKEIFASRSFSHATPALWNSLPRCLQDESSTTVFKIHLQMYLFKNEFNL